MELPCQIRRPSYLSNKRRYHLDQTCRTLERMSAKIVVKKNLIIFRNPEEDWMPIRKKLLEEYGPSINISFVMRERLGFTVRNHTTWISGGKGDFELEWKYPEEQTHLDFFSEPAQTWFQLRYLNR
jgi:hypothetical protein